MSSCCIGGVCIPTQAVIPVCILLLRQMYIKCMSWLNLVIGKEVHVSTKPLSCCGGADGGNCNAENKINGSNGEITRRGKRRKNDENSDGVVFEAPKLMKDIDEFQTVLKKHEIVVVKFTATWCNPCKAIEPCFISLYRQCYNLLGKKVSFVKVDVDDLDEIAQEYRISMMPTFIVFQDGKNISQMAGSDENQFGAFVQKYVCDKMN